MGDIVQSTTPVVTLTKGYWMAETEVTYELWDEVHTWAIVPANGYTFAHVGVQGDGSGDTNQHPVTTINWRDAMIWCNALSEKQGLTPVYYTDNTQSTVIRIVNDTASILPANGDIANDCVKWAANGYRLPTEAEWEYASRYRDGSDWTPGDYASGATADYTNGGATGLVAWYNGSSTQPVGQKNANALGINDMSGNVWECCWDWFAGYGGGPLTDPHGPAPGPGRFWRGGGWGDDAGALQCAGRFNAPWPYREFGSFGFRPVRNE